tara:strand:+ start:2741 stop:4666 length:1926 start_codon:yes stop_codon:yes gene_type:complete
MKWIGQNIYDLIARFRSDVYLESISSGTIASGGYLGLDSNNKIVKATSEGDITGITLTAGTGVDLTSISGATGGAYAATIGVDVSDFMANGVNTGVVTATGTDAMTSNAYFTFSNDAGETNTSLVTLKSNEDVNDYSTIGTTTNGATKITTVDAGAAAAHFEIEADGDITLDATGSIYNEADAIYFTSTSASNPIVNIKNTHSGTTGARLRFTKDKGAAGADGDDIGSIEFFADNTAQELTSFASIVSEVSESNDGDEAGKLSFFVAESNSSSSQLTAGLVLEGEHATDGEVDATIAAGTASTTTIAGNLTVTSDLTVTGDTLTFSSANADDPAVWIKNTADDDQSTRMLFLKERGADGQDGDECGAIYFYSYDDGTPSLQQYGYILSTIHDATSGEESGRLDIGVANHDGGSEPGVSMVGGSANGEVDVTIGSGTDSLTTIAGDLSVTTGLILDSVDVTAIQTSGESYADSDTTLMTSSAIDARINRSTKVIQIITANFKDDQGTSETFLPISGPPTERTGLGEQTGFIMPTPGNVKEIIVRAHYATYTSENIVFKVYKRESDKKANSKSQVGSDITIAAPTQSTSASTNTRSTGEITHAYGAGDLLLISMTHQSTGPTSANDRTYVTIVLENDLTDLGY